MSSCTASLWLVVQNFPQLLQFYSQLDIICVVLWMIILETYSSQIQIVRLGLGIKCLDSVKSLTGQGYFEKSKHSAIYLLHLMSKVEASTPL